MPKARYLRIGATLGAVLCLLWGHAGDAVAQFGSGSGFGGGPGAGMQGPQQQAKRRYVPQQFAPQGPTTPVAEVRLVGKHSVSESRIRAKLQTREGRPFDPNSVQADVRELIASGLCYDVRTLTQETPNGVIVTLELFEQPTIGYIEFTGTKVREKTLLKKAELAVGQPLNRFRVEESQRRLEDYFRSRGNSHVKVTIAEGAASGDKGVRFSIEEGPRQRISWTGFDGNTIVSDSRLRTYIDSKPGILWLFKGQVDRDVIEEDKAKLTAFYRSLGFFNATVVPELKFDDEQEWLTLKFVINEGPRYRIRNVSLQGNEVFATDDLLSATELKEGDFFDQGKMNAAVGNLKNLYGAQGYINVDVKAEPKFDLEPGQLDMVYQVTEGKQYRIGEIKVNIEGDHPHTRQTVVLNQLDMREGDIIDINKIRNSKVRLSRSQLFENGPLGGPDIAVQPRESETQFANRPTDTLR